MNAHSFVLEPKGRWLAESWDDGLVLDYRRWDALLRSRYWWSPYRRQYISWSRPLEIFAERACQPILRLSAAIVAVCPLMIQITFIICKLNVARLSSASFHALLPQLMDLIFLQKMIHFLCKKFVRKLKLSCKGNRMALASRTKISQIQRCEEEKKVFLFLISNFCCCKLMELKIYFQAASVLKAPLDTPKRATTMCPACLLLGESISSLLELVFRL